MPARLILEASVCGGFGAPHPAFGHLLPEGEGVAVPRCVCSRSRLMSWIGAAIALTVVGWAGFAPAQAQPAPAAAEARPSAAASEKAVQRALVYLKRAQKPDG